MTKPQLNLPKRLFWDVEYEKIDWNEKWFFVIERVLQRGDISEFSQVLHYYGREKVVEVVQKARYFDQKTKNFLHIYFQISTSKMLCYSTPPSVQALWPY